MKIIDKLQVELSKIINKRYEKKIRDQLTNDCFTILCPTCIGGIIYHRLGKQFLSPTINMWMHQPQFLIFVENLRECLAAELRFVETEQAYPVAQITCRGGVVTLHFNHAKTEQEARDNWERRKMRVNYDNLYIIMYDMDGITKEDIGRLANVPCKNKVVLSEKEYADIDYVVTLKKAPSESTNFLDKNRFGMRTFEKQWDYVTFLNTK